MSEVPVPRLVTRDCRCNQRTGNTNLKRWIIWPVKILLQLQWVALCKGVFFSINSKKHYRNQLKNRLTIERFHLEHTADGHRIAVPAQWNWVFLEYNSALDAFLPLWTRLFLPVTDLYNLSNEKEMGELLCIWGGFQKQKLLFNN